MSLLLSSCSNWSLYSFGWPERFTNLSLNFRSTLSFLYCTLTFFSGEVNSQLCVNLLLDECFVMNCDFFVILNCHILGDLLKCCFDNRLWLEEVDVETAMVNLYH